MTLEAHVRRMEADDAAGVDAMLRATREGLPDSAFYAWKHGESPFGRSPAWVALVEGRVVAYRTFLRWEFDAPEGHLRAVRAVDTATHPDFQGRGLFTRLTLRAIEELAGEGVHLVFNTPNDKSRPGYLKMGWTAAGRLPVAFLPRSLRALPRVLRARGAADRQSLPTTAGLPAREVLADDARVSRILARLPKTERLATHRSTAYLRWRYGFEPLCYRALLVDCARGEGVLFFRLRSRGHARELVIADALLPAGSRREARRAVREALRLAQADYALGLRARSLPLWPLPGAGPQLLTRPLADPGPWPLSRFALTLGDVELF